MHFVTDDTIIATTGPTAVPVCGNGTVVALNKADNTVKWQVTNPWPLARAARAGDMVLMLYNCGDLVALKADSGSTVWAKSWTAREPGTAASDQVVVFVRSLSCSERTPQRLLRCCAASCARCVCNVCSNVLI